VLTEKIIGVGISTIVIGALQDSAFKQKTFKEQAWHIVVYIG
jgi:hypothetical protein